MRSLLLACVAVLAIAGEASAQSEPQIELLDPPPGRRAPRDLPLEGSLPVTTNLFVAPSGEPFRSAPGAPYPVTAWFARADADHDGRLTLPEFIDDSLVFFKQLDANNDGVVDGFEGAAYEKTIVPELGAQRADLGMRPPPRRTGGFLGFGAKPVRSVPPEGAALYGLLNEPQPVNGADSDLDRRVSRAEATAAATRRFRRLDTDGDGALRLDALPTTPAQMQVMEREARR